MSFAQTYLAKHLFLPLSIQEKPLGNTGIIIVIPSYNEPELFTSLECLYNCTQPSSAVEVIVVINSSEKNFDKVQSLHDKTCDAFIEWEKQHRDNGIRFYLIRHESLPDKDAGVGLARKLGMDEAAARYSAIYKPNGIILGFDADATCSKNYLLEVEQFFIQNPETVACSIQYEHPISGDYFEEDIYASIYLYELYLRYYVEALRFAKYPYAYHTLGSSFGVRALPYILQLGMNKRKAGEDFYFLNKMMLLGKYGEIHNACVYPSPRVSDRVPFGTGAAIKKMLGINDRLYYTYHPLAFEQLRIFIEMVPRFYKIESVSLEIMLQSVHPGIVKYLIQRGLYSKIEEINRYTSGLESFLKRFFYWLNGLEILHLLNYLHVEIFEKIPVVEASYKLMTDYYHQANYSQSDPLCFFRQLNHNSK